MTWSEATPVFGAFLVCLGSGLLAVSAVSGHPAGLTEQSGLLVAAGVAFVLAGTPERRPEFVDEHWLAGAGYTTLGVVMLISGYTKTGFGATLAAGTGTGWLLAGCLSVALGVGTGVRPAVVGSDRTDAES
ncbi:hypothetical protein [Halobacterium salinarum]|uniref:Uncharacterized protein n=5 Tax=Halobacterium salinarum TaxID=2242 RepID=A0A510N4G3_HALSA|nr:hypothetical protein [Halobacterium salinarum]MBB6089748.1 hypothetical protein [Halobacterium salinarum]MDL0124101.1 hypothetical protein [Halobacterium salinarum]MDL0129366.1 hypothetical protein [Halobacterium salinarum]MDL0141488.1 hypothetical protein [Halobacterium salinarum]MDL0144162.1 hypothetical protein [Halobacterium salinarum]